MKRLCVFRRSVVLAQPWWEEADEPELIVRQGDHAGRIVFMGLPVDVFLKLEDPSEPSGGSSFEGGESLPETFLGQGINQESHRHDGDDRHDPDYFLRKKLFTAVKPLGKRAFRSGHRCFLTYECRFDSSILKRWNEEKFELFLRF